MPDYTNNPKPAHPTRGVQTDADQTPDHSDDDVVTVDVRRGLGRRRTPSASQRASGAAGGSSDYAHNGGESSSLPRGRRGHRARRGLGVVLLIVVAWVAAIVWAGFSGWGHVNRVDALPQVADRPSAGSGHNYILVGSDSRAGLSKAERKKLATGNQPGQRTDSIMLVHLGSGEPTLVSIPRDSYVPIRGHHSNKINAAYSLGGPQLLIDTVEQVSGLRVDGFIEIGFGGFASVVDSLDGVDMCLKNPMNDKKAGIKLKAGCQTLDGANALGYVRARYSDPLGDFGRVQRQRQFLGALLGKAASPANVLLPWRLHSISTAGAEALTVDKDASALDVAKVMLAIRDIGRGHGISTTVPVSNPNLQTSAGSAVKWDSAKALALFNDLKLDRPLSIKP